MLATRTTVGIETLRDSGWADLVGKRCAALVHSASALPDTLIHTVDALASAPGVRLEAILAPEHGFRGDRQAEHGDPKPYVDPDTGIWVHSVYRKNETTLAKLLQSLDAEVVLIDIQDAGTRLYTFIWTLFSLMQAAATLPRPPTFLVTDRPNPLGGVAVEGPVLNTSCCASRYGRAAVPHVHGLTVGEASLLFASVLRSPTSAARSLNVSVIRMTSWRRSMLFEATSLPWLPPSPNLPTAESAIAYAATVFIEATTASEGRGTTKPFQLVGAPFLNASRLVARLAASPGGSVATSAKAARLHRWRKTFFIPTWFKWNGTVCAGAQLVRPSGREKSAVDASAGTGGDGGSKESHRRAHGSDGGGSTHLFREGIHLLSAMRTLAEPPTAFAWDGGWFGQPGSILVDRYAGTPRLRKLLDTGMHPDDVADAFVAEAREFDKIRQPFLLYS